MFNSVQLDHSSKIRNTKFTTGMTHTSFSVFKSSYNAVESDLYFLKLRSCVTYTGNNSHSFRLGIQA